jgi:hypothetical protein
VAFGELRAFKGRVQRANRKSGQIAGKALNQALSRDHIAARRSLHGKEGVDGRVRQRALRTRKYLQIG